MKIQFEWKDANIEPIMDKPVVYLTEHNNIGSFKHTMTCLGGNWKEPFSGWKRLIDKYKIKFWVYKDELLNGFAD